MKIIENFTMKKSGKHRSQEMQKANKKIRKIAKAHDKKKKDNAK